jgi:hypothetical protein
MKLQTYKPDLIRARIVRVKSELRQLKMILRLSEAEERDRQRLEPTVKAEGSQEKKDDLGSCKEVVNNNE